MPRTERIQKQKETATKVAAHGTTNIRAWFPAPHPTQTLKKQKILQKKH